MPILEYVSTFREYLHKAWDIAKQHLSDTQAKMKTRYDRKSIARSFQPGDSVLVLLPAPNSPLHARFLGPYTIEKKLSDTNYTVLTPDRRRKSRLCHINMLKSYVDRNGSGVNLATNSVSAVNVVGLPTGYEPEVDGLIDKDVLTSCGRFSNSASLSTLPLWLRPLLISLALNVSSYGMKCVSPHFALPRICCVMLQSCLPQISLCPSLCRLMQVLVAPVRC